MNSGSISLFFFNASSNFSNNFPFSLTIESPIITFSSFKFNFFFLCISIWFSLSFFSASFFLVLFTAIRFNLFKLNCLSKCLIYSSSCFNVIFFIWLILSNVNFLFLSSNLLLIPSYFSCNFLNLFSLFLIEDKNKLFWLFTLSNICSFFCFPIFSAFIFTCNWCFKILSFLFCVSSFDFFNTSSTDLNLFSYLNFCSSKFRCFSDDKPVNLFWVLSYFKSKYCFNCFQFLSFLNLFLFNFSIFSNSFRLFNKIRFSLSFSNNSLNCFSLLIIFSSFSLFLLAISFNLSNIFSLLFSYNLKFWVFLKSISFWFFSCNSWYPLSLFCSALYLSSFLFSLSFILFSKTCFLNFSFSLNLDSSIIIFCFLSSFILSFNSFILISLLSLFILSISVFNSFSIFVSITLFCLCLIFSKFFSPFFWISDISFFIASFPSII